MSSLAARSDFGGTLELREAYREALVILPDDWSFLIAQWSSAEELIGWTTGGPHFHWDKQLFLELLRDEADSIEAGACHDDEVTERILEMGKAADRLELREKQFAHLYDPKCSDENFWQEISDRLKRGTPPIEGAVLVFVSPPHLDLPQGYWCNRMILRTVCLRNGFALSDVGPLPYLRSLAARMERP